LISREDRDIIPFEPKSIREYQGFQIFFKHGQAGYNSMSMNVSNLPKRILMGPGPSDVNARVLEAMRAPTIGHLDPGFIDLMDDIKKQLQAVFQTSNELTMPVSGPGSAGMEAGFVNLLEPGDSVAVCVNGVFGTRMKEVAKRCGANVVAVEHDWGKAVDPVKVDKALSGAGKVKVLAFVHAETSTGALSDARTLAEIGHRHGCLVLADAVTSLGGVPVLTDEWGLDAVYSGSQKCLSCPPGLSPLTFNAKAADAVRSRKTPVQSWFLDLSLIMAYWGSGAKRTYHHTAPINSLYGLHEALRLVLEEGLEKRWARHARLHRALFAGISGLGLSFFVDEKVRTPMLNSVTVPPGVDEAGVRNRLLNDFNLEIGAGLGPLAGKIWRIGLMGESCSEKNVRLCVAGIAAILNDMGFSCSGTDAQKKIDQALA